MYIPTLQSTIDRRLLVNYRFDPSCLQKLLPDPFRPKLVRGMGIAGICLIRLKQLRPGIVPARLGFRSENAAHRIAVEWEEHGTCREGVYIPRRDSSSRFNILVGGRLFPGIHHHAHFQVAESDDAFVIHMTSDDGKTYVSVEAHAASHLPENSILASLEEISSFFEQGSRGYSPTREAGKLDCRELSCFNWKVEPLQVTEVQSSFFEDHQRFPPGSAELDNALLMRAIRYEWYVREPFCTTESAAGTKRLIEAGKKE